MPSRYVKVLPVECVPNVSAKSVVGILLDLLVS